MITEAANSRVFHYTVDGETITQIYTMTKDEADNGSGFDKDGTFITLPVVGLPWNTTNKRYVCVTDILISPIPDNTEYVEFIATYSSTGQRWSKNISDSIASTELLFDFQSYPSDSDGYFDFGTLKTESWSDIYTTSYRAANAGASPKEIPPRITEFPKPTMVISGKVKNFNFSVVADAIGSVNLEKEGQSFLETWSERYVTDVTGRDTWADAINLAHPFQDGGKWLFAGFQARTIGRDSKLFQPDAPNYEIISTFIYEFFGWNNIYSVTGYQGYNIYDFFLLPRPTDHSSTVGGPGF